MKYRETTIDFYSNISKEDVIAAEDVLFYHKYDRKDNAKVWVQKVLQEICHALLDLEIYDEESDEHSTI